MANEAELVQDLEFRHMQVDVAVSGTFLKGSLLGLFDPQIGSVTGVQSAPFAGIALQDKVQDGVDSISLSKYAVWDLVHSGTLLPNAGDIAGLSTDINSVSVIPVAIAGSGGRAVGIFTQDATNGERVQVLVGGF